MKKPLRYGGKTRKAQTKRQRHQTWRKLTKRGGARDTLPLPATFAEFQAAWDFFYVTSHGLFEDRLMIVPPNTYVLNMATAGRSCMKLDRYIDDLIYEKPSSGSGASATSALESLYTEIRDRSFLRSLGRGGKLTEHMFMPGTTARNEEEQYTNRTDPKATPINAAEMSLAIYEPGDIMFDTQLHTMNDRLPLIVLGVYKIPVPFSMRQAVFDINKPVILPGKTIFNVDQYDVNMSIPKTANVWKATEEHHQLFNVAENLIKGKMFPEAGAPVPYMYLSEVIDFTNTASNDGKQHFFMVNACRSAETEETSRLARRLSIAARANRERVGINAATLVTHPQKKYRSALNRAFLERILGALPGRIPKLTAEKAELEATRAGLATSGKTGKERAIANYKLQSAIEDKTEEIAKVEAAVAKLTRILERSEPFTITELLSSLRPAKSGLQPEFVKLLGL
jgi:hypothetical protein